MFIFHCPTVLVSLMVQVSGTEKADRESLSRQWSSAHTWVNFHSWALSLIDTGPGSALPYAVCDAPAK